MKKTLFLAAFWLLSFSACAPRYYAPNEHVVPLLSKKGNLHFNAGATTNCRGFSGAYALTKNIAIQAGYTKFWKVNKEDSDYAEIAMREIGLGIFKRENDLIQETYLLFAMGMADNKFPTGPGLFTANAPEGFLKADFKRYGLQHNIGFIHKNVELGASLRIANLVYENISGALVYEDLDQNIYLEENKSNFYLSLP